MLNVSGLVAIVLFYLLILGVGLWAAWRRKRTVSGGSNDVDEVMLAGRSIGTFVGCLTMTGNEVFFSGKKNFQ